MSQSVFKADTIFAPDARITQESGNDLSDFIQESVALTKRLIIQLQRRPSTLIAGIIQPFMWLVLFAYVFVCMLALQ